MYVDKAFLRVYNLIIRGDQRMQLKQSERIALLLAARESVFLLENRRRNVRNRSYIAIDLKSFYASVECVERGLDPLTTNLVVADIDRTEKTICLAVSPSLKAYGIPGRARLFEVVQKVKEVNATRMRTAPGRTLSGSSFDALELKD